MSEQTQAGEAQVPASEGVRARRAIMLKQFLPDPNWIMTNVVVGGKGTRATIGRIFGIITGYETKWNNIPGQDQPVESIALRGMLQTENYITGELGEGTMVYLPAAYSEKVRAILAQGERKNEAGEVVGNDVKAVEIDCDVGVEATGKTIPYEWVIVAFREGEEMAVLKRLRNTRARPAYVLQSGERKLEAVPRPAEQAALPAPTPEPVAETELAAEPAAAAKPKK